MCVNYSRRRLWRWLHFGRLVERLTVTESCLSSDPNESWLVHDQMVRRRADTSIPTALSMAAYVYRLGFESGPRSSRDTGGAAKLVEGSAMRDASSCKVLSWEVISRVPLLKLITGLRRRYEYHRLALQWSPKSLCHRRQAHM